MATGIEQSTRRAFLSGIITLPALAGLLTAAASADASKASKAAMHYQDTPNGNSSCSGCRYFVAGQSGSASGSCQIVDGAISPTGYCMAFTAK